MLTWTLLAAGIVAGLGAAAALFRYRFGAAIEADSEAADEEAAADSADGRPGPVPLDTAREGTDSSANGRVKASGW